MMEAIELEIEMLEERIAPSQPPGLLGFEGQPGNQGDGGGTGASHRACWRHNRHPACDRYLRLTRRKKRSGARMFTQGTTQLV
jgi:hypothetical protein